MYEFYLPMRKVSTVSLVLSNFLQDKAVNLIKWRDRSWLRRFPANQIKNIYMLEKKSFLQRSMVNGSNWPSGSSFQCLREEPFPCITESLWIEFILWAEKFVRLPPFFMTKKQTHSFVNQLEPALFEQIFLPVMLGYRNAYSVDSFVFIICSSNFYMIW